MHQEQRNIIRIVYTSDCMSSYSLSMFYKGFRPTPLAYMLFKTVIFKMSAGGNLENSSETHLLQQYILCNGVYPCLTNPHGLIDLALLIGISHNYCWQVITDLLFSKLTACLKSS